MKGKRKYSVNLNEVGYPILFSIIPPLGSLLYNEAKKRMTYPRVGYMKFTKERSGRVAIDMIIVFIVAGLLTLSGLFTGMGEPEHAPWGVLLLNRYNLLFLGGVVALMFLLMSMVMGVARLRLYSVLTMLVYPAGYLYLDSPFEVSLRNLGAPLVIIGAAVVGIGVYLLQGFLRRYSKEA